MKEEGFKKKGLNVWVQRRASFKGKRVVDSDSAGVKDHPPRTGGEGPGLVPRSKRGAGGGVKVGKANSEGKKLRNKKTAIIGRDSRKRKEKKNS